MGETSEQRLAREQEAREAKAKAAREARKENLNRDVRTFSRNCANDQAAVQVLLEKHQSVENNHQIAAHLDSWKEALKELAKANNGLMDYIDASLDAAIIAEQEKEITKDHDASKAMFNRYTGTYKMLVESLRPTESSKSGSRNGHSLVDSFDGPLLDPFVRLKDVPLPIFDGTFKNFPDWYSEFCGMVDKSARYNTHQKMYLLKRAMGKGAEHLVEDIEDDEDGCAYKLTLESLYDSFFNRRRIIVEHFITIADLPTVKNTSIRESVHKVKRALRGLKVSGINVEEMSPFVSFLISRKLPDKLRGDWDDSHRDNSVYPSFESLASFLINKCFTYETASIKGAPSSNEKSNASAAPNKGQVKQSRQIIEKKSLVAATDTQRTPQSSSSFPLCCVVCQQSHYLDQCPTFLSKTPKQRFDVVKSNRLCIKCFKNNHTVSKCTNKYNCATCHGPHHKLLHINREEVPLTNTNNTNELPVSPVLPDVKNVNFVNDSSNANRFCALSSHKTVFLSTAVVKVQGTANTELGRVLFDQGSESTLITRDFCERLKLKMYEANNPTVLVGINDKSVELKKFVRCVLKSRYTDFQIAIEAVVIDRIPYRVCRNELKEIATNFNYNLAEYFDLPYDHVDLLLGNEFVEFCLLEKRYFLEGICLRDSHFGFVISGSRKSPYVIQTTEFCGLSNLELSNQFHKFYALDDIPENKLEKSLQHELIEGHFESTYHIDENTGKFVIRLPTKESILSLKGSFEKARALLVNSERRRSERKHESYVRIFDEYLKLGHMSEIDSTPDPSAYYIPHHIVSKETPSGPSDRIVFNASFVDNSGTSLNDHLLEGPVLQPNLAQNIVRFRQHLIAFVADIYRMYRCILIDKKDRKYQRILFRFILNSLIKIFELNTLTNGVGPASYLATKCLEIIGKALLVDDPEVARAILEDFYMDNLMSGAANIDAAVRLQKSIHAALGKYGFPLLKYQSNSLEFLSNIEPSLIEPLNNRCLGGNEFVMLLGLIWYPQSDTLSVKICLDSLPEVITKRVVLSEVSKIFDVLGMLAPTTVIAKIMLQELWKEGRGWDEPVSNELSTSFQEYRNDLVQLSSFSIKRCYFSSNKIASRQLIGYCDASTRAYCAVVYLRSVDCDGKVNVSFICAKNRIAPIKTVHIHRLELMSAELLSRMIAELRKDLGITEYFCFSDSMVGLSWINLDPLKLKVFVSNRVTNILALTCKERWFHIDGKMNPADLGTRGISSNSLLKSVLWLAGPPWLQDNFVSFVSSKFKPSIDVPEMKEESTVLSILAETRKPFSEIVFRNSSIFKMVSVAALCLRFVTILRWRVWMRRAIAEGEQVTMETFHSVKPCAIVSSLSIQERDYAYWSLMRFVQMEFFEKEYLCLLKGHPIPRKSRLLSLNVFIAHDGLMRAGGRLAASNFSYDTKFPVIIAAKSLYLERFIEYTHRKYYHCTKSFIYNFVRARFFVIGNLAAIIKKVVRRCIVCTRFDAHFVEQLMGDLPKERVTISRPFATAGVDLTGAISIKCTNHRVGKVVKVYACFFVCFLTRAVHIEIVEDLTSEAFLNALERFASRRGFPSLIYSDNGTNFVGARNILMQSRLDKYLVENRIEWKMIAPRSPHQGGLWESAVKAGKSLLMKSIGTQILSLMELSTILCKIEAILNSRPLSYRLTNEFVEPVTPGHFLVGSALLETPVLDNGSVTLKQRYMLWRRIVDSFWVSWRHDYLNQLQQRGKWKERMENVSKGDVVLVSSPNDRVMNWPMGRIVDVYPDKKGIVRNVSVRLGNGTVRRTSVQKLVALPVDVSKDD